MESALDDIGILKNQLVMLEEHFDHNFKMLSVSIVSGAEYPNGLGEDQQGNPRAVADKFLGKFGLINVISNDESYQEICVDGPHRSARTVLFANVLPDAFLQFVEGFRLWGALGK